MGEAPLSLHFGLVEGGHIDLEVLARATLEWAAAVRDLADIVSPGLEIDIEFVESQEGSVWLKNLVKAVRDGDRAALSALIFSTILFFAMSPALHFQADLGEKFWKMLGDEHKAELDEKTQQEIADKVAEALRETPLGERRRKIVKIVEQDNAVSSIGVGLTPKYEGPIVTIPREAFPVYGASAPKAQEAGGRKADISRRLRVTIVRPTLRDGDAKPRWRFSDGETEWSADLDDGEFVEALHTDQTGLHLAVRQQMIVDVVVESRMVDGAWQEENRRIIRVIDPAINRRQIDLDLGGD